MAITHISENDRLKAQDLAKEARQKKLAYAQEHLKLEYMDMPYWEDLARKHGFRLAMSYLPCSELKYAKRVMKHLGVDSVWWLEHNACSMKQWAEDNSTYTARAMQGIILESYEGEL